MSKKHDSELEVPEQIIDDLGAKEALRIWVCGNGKVVINSRKKINRKEELTDFFIMLALSVARHDMFSFYNTDAPD